MEVVALLKQLIACRSVTPRQAGALELAQTTLEAAGFSARRLPAGEVDNLWADDGAPTKLIFAGHVDVVPPGDLDAWDTDPFIASERGGFVYGRGAADMKSGVAAMLTAACNLRRRGASGIAVLLTSDEEGDAIHGTRHVVEWLRQRDADISYAIVGEPTCGEHFGDTIKIGRRGSLTARLAVLGKQAHAAYARPKDNPAHQLTAALGDLLAQFAAPLEEGKGEKKSCQDDSVAAIFPPTSLQVVKMTCGVADNVVASRAEATINFRYAPDTDAEELRRQTEECLQRAAGEWRCDWTDSARPFMGRADGALAAALRESVDAATGQRAALSADGGTSDGRFLREVCREVAEFGVQNETMHAANERVECESVRQLADIYFQTALRLLS